MKSAFVVILASVLLVSKGYAFPMEAEVSIARLFVPSVALIFCVQRRTQQTCGFTTVPLLRGYSAKATDHFYTTTPSQMENAILNHSYKSEGDAAFVLPSQAPDTVPLYRLYSATAKDHFYTTSNNERTNAIQNHGFKDEGITAYVYPSNLCGTVPLYRMYNPTATDHFYTTDVTQKDRAITVQGYVDEGIAAYVNPQ